VDGLPLASRVEGIALTIFGLEIEHLRSQKLPIIGSLGGTGLLLIVRILARKRQAARALDEGGFQRFYFGPFIYCYRLLGRLGGQNNAS
jgi:hypothetical protein